MYFLDMQNEKEGGELADCPGLFIKFVFLYVDK